MKDVVVLLPGIGGSVLARDGKDVWAPTPGVALASVLSLGRNIKTLKLDGDDPDVDDLGDGVVATRLVPDFHFVPGLDWKIDGYTKFRDDLVRRFGAVPGDNYFELPYDWRRDNRVAARTLARRSHDWLARWREKSGNADAKLVLVCHSMGGIVARLFLELLDGWRDTRTLVTFGTPYSGSVNALDFLVNGFRKGWGPFTVDLGALIGSFTSAYQLLPSYRCMAGDDGSWRALDDTALDWSGTGLDAGRMGAAVRLHRGLRDAVDARLKSEPQGYDIRPVIGDFQPTKWAARLAGSKVETMTVRGPGESGGDGTVPKLSATPHELMTGWKNAAFFSQRHGSLQNDDPVLDHVGGILTTAVLAPPNVFPAVNESVALEVDDVTTTEPLVIRARTGAGGARLVASVEPVAGGPGRRHPLSPAVDGWQQAVLDGLSAQDYRITVRAPGVHPVTDVASVVDLDEIARSVDA
ncbi:lipase/acyltransferase domain-containing protein [Rhodococcus koreensis]|uniref:lipase/acyltransferase domain-containing protein n=1 Tax=Rhodococcus koreensis TaxID=99653 RepID=UPI0036D8534E